MFIVPRSSMKAIWACGAIVVKEVGREGGKDRSILIIQEWRLTVKIAYWKRAVIGWALVIIMSVRIRPERYFFFCSNAVSKIDTIRIF